MAEYEASPDYQSKLIENVSLYSIDEKPKRLGVVPDSVEENSSLSEVEKIRYIMKRDGGKSAMATAAIKYKDSSLIQSLSQQQ